MRILAIESSGRDVSVAALDGGETGAQLLREVVIPGSQRTAQALAPSIAELFAQLGWEPKSVQLVAVAIGPGSFTGLRIGVTTAKTLAYAVGAEVIGVNTLDVIAHQAPSMTSPLWSIMDAQRKELFAAKFGVTPHGRWETLVETSVDCPDCRITIDIAPDLEPVVAVAA